MKPNEADELDPLTRATVTVAWVIFLNKPFYPLYVWYLVGHGITASLATLISAPFFFAVVLVAKRSPLASRILLPAVGTLDTAFETTLFGQGAGTELFFAACIMLVALSFRPQEKIWQYAMTIFVFCVFVASRTFNGQPWYPWSAGELSTLLNLNIFAVASLLAFIALRYAGSARA